MFRKKNAFTLFHYDGRFFARRPWVRRGFIVCGGSREDSTIFGVKQNRAQPRLKLGGRLPLCPRRTSLLAMICDVPKDDIAPPQWACKNGITMEICTGQTEKKLCKEREREKSWKTTEKVQRVRTRETFTKKTAAGKSVNGKKNNKKTNRHMALATAWSKPPPARRRRKKRVKGKNILWEPRSPATPS